MVKSTSSSSASSVVSLPSAWKSVVPSFPFMKHDKWSNVLFLHWRVPKELESLLKDHTSPFQLDRTPDGSAWIGLVLLTEQNVGPTLFRTSGTCVTHHGLNVRTYLQGYQNKPDGICFASLECDDRFTAFGANYFGMPYKVAKMQRSFYPKKKFLSETDIDTKLSARQVDDSACQSKFAKGFSFESFRLKQQRNLPLQMLKSCLSFTKEGLHSTIVAKHVDSEELSKKSKLLKSQSKDDSSFSVECEWEISEQENDATQDPLAQFFVERYVVYTKKYGRNWYGQVQHEAWPVQDATLRRPLSMSNIDSYEPAALQPLLQHMSGTAPDSVLYSHGVGPILFQMLQPI
mmetsp:Transcript_2648/g.3953  ORF Transcript_2648/g.3953 Transcript_2648/m.3953 type:complete len:346 (+) Transcript_2648:283-1320(+)